MRAMLVVMLATASLASPADNILLNPDIELGGKKSAVGWRTDIRKGDYEFFIAGSAHSGERCLAIKAGEDTTQGWARWYTTDLYLLEGATYRLCAWVKTEGEATAEVCVPSKGKGITKRLADSPEWTRLDGDFSVSRTGRHGIYLQSMRGGAVYFDDITIEMVEAPPAVEGGEVPTDGEPIVGIVTPDAAGPHHGYLAQEIQRILEAMTGQAPAISAASSIPKGDAGRRIWIGVAPPGRNYAPQLGLVGEEGIVVDIGPRAVVCLGNTPRGVYYAVHELFYVLGCRWCWPGPLGEVIPKVEELSLPPCLIVHKPSFDLRGGHTVQVYHTPPDWKPKHVNTELWVDWAARNRMNRIKGSYPTMWSYGAIRGGEWNEFAGHTLYTILPPKKWFESHPEFYPLVKGKRTHKHSSGRNAEVCVSNPQLPQVVADYICEYFASHPEAKRFGINAEDEPDYWCECEHCKALDTEELDWSKNGVECMRLTDRWMYFINKVAELVEKQCPEKVIFTFAYGSTRELPHKHLPRRNVMIELTWWDRCFKHETASPRGNLPPAPLPNREGEATTTPPSLAGKGAGGLGESPACEINAKGMQRFHDWSRLAGLSIYRYLDYHHMESPCPYYHAEADILRTVHAAGCRHLSDEWDSTFTSSPLLLNLRARLAWDVNTDVDAYMDDFCARVYGKAGPTIARYFRRLERGVYESPTDHVRFNNTKKFTPEVLKDGHALLDGAEKLADDDDILARVDRLRYSLLFAELDQVAEAAKEDPALFARQAEIQQRLWSLVQKRQIEPVLGYFGKLGTQYKPPVAAITGRRVLQLPEEWLFRTDPQKVGEEEKWFSRAPDDSWKPISIHKAWEGQGYEGYDGDAWYTIEVEIPAIPEKRVWLLCEAVDETFKLWINGEYVGASEGDPGLLWDKPVAVDIAGKFNPGAKNRITMRVHDSRFAGGIWKPVWITASDSGGLGR